LSDDTALLVKEKIDNTGKLNLKLFWRLIIILINNFYSILIIVETFEQNLINIQYDIASEFIEEQNNSQSRDLNNLEITEEGKT